MRKCEEGKEGGRDGAKVRRNEGTTGGKDEKGEEANVLRSGRRRWLGKREGGKECRREQRGTTNGRKDIKKRQLMKRGSKGCPFWCCIHYYHCFKVSNEHCILTHVI